VKFKVRILALAAVALLAVPAPAMSSGANTVYLTGTLSLTESDALSGVQAPDGYSLSTGDAEITLAVTGDARDKAGATVGFTGTKLSDDRVAVSAAAIVVLAPASVPSVSASGAGEVTPATATKKVLVIIGDYNDLAGNPVTADQADIAFNTDPASVKSYFETTSRGRMTTTTTVKGPWALNISNCSGGANGVWSNSRSAVTTVAAANGVNLADYDYIVLWTKVPCGVGWIGQAELPGRYAQILVDYSQYPGDEPALATMVATHEMEHNMFLYHSQGLGCFDASNNQVVLTGSNDCLAFGYADQYTTMGSSGASNHALLDAERLRELGWLDASESQTVTSAGTYTIVPTYSALAGSRELRIVAPNPVNTGHGGVWTIELRSTLAGSPFDQFSGSSLPGATGITIRYSENDVSGFGYSYLVDTVANGYLSGGACYCSFWDAPLQPGGTVTDTMSGLSIKLNSVTASGASVTIGDTVPPTTPATLTATPLAGGGARLDWTASTDNLALAGYRLYRDSVQIGSVDGSTLTYTDPVTSGVYGLHTYSVKAVDTAGLLSSAASATATLIGYPDAPTAVTATAGNAAALVSWTAPANGGAAITGYTVASTPGGAYTCTTTGATSCVVTGLTNGSPYKFVVTATNGIGTGPASAASNQVTPLTVPGRPTVVAGTPGAGSVTVSWTAPDLGGGTFSGYVATASPGGQSCPITVATTCVVGGLSNGVAYTFTVVASNSLGNGLASDPSAPVTPRTVPGKPTGVTAVASNTVATVSWLAPASNGGSTISLYTVTSVPDGKQCVTATLSCPVTGLTNRTSYQFKVIATNVAGDSAQSDPSAGVVPLLGATYVPVTPNRLVDSRPGAGQQGLSSALSNQVPARFQVTNRTSDQSKNIPSNAVAVTGNLTAVSSGASGYLSLTPTMPVGVPGTSTLNFPAGDIRANAVTTPIGSDGGLWVTFVGVGGTMHAVFDVTGYFLPNTSAATYVPVPPTRLVDSRPGAGQQGLYAALSNQVPAVFTATGGVIPPDAVAVTGNLTAVSSGASGYFGLTPTSPGTVPGTSTLNFPASDIRANAVTAPLGPGGTLWVTFVGIGGTMHVVFDVTGYFVSGTSGATYVPVSPTRLVDSRPGTGQQGLYAALNNQVPAEFTATGGVIPADVDTVAVTGNLTAVSSGASGYFGLTPTSPGAVPGTSTLNFPGHDIRANAVTAPLGPGGTLWVTFVGIGGTMHVVFDVSGYFTRK
jgi:hypothetical protein